MIPENKKLSDFCEINKFEHLILKPICFKGLLPSTIDFLLTNHKQSFMGLNVYEWKISDHHTMIILVLNKKTVFYCCYKHFDQDSFNKTLENRISVPNLSFEKFFEIFQSTFSYFAPYKQKDIRYNNNPFMTKRLRKEIMIRSKLRNKFNKPRTGVNLQNDKKQRNKCPKALRKAK